MIQQNLMFTCPLLAAELDTKTIVAILVVLVGSVIAFISWLLMLSRLITLAEGKKSINHYLMWSFLIPFVNLLWLPWTLIVTNGLILKAQDNFHKINAINTGAAVQILSVPILILYLFWTVLGIIVGRFLPAQMDRYDLILHVSIILTCVLIVLCFYLIYLAFFVHKFKGQSK